MPYTMYTAHYLKEQLKQELINIRIREEHSYNIFHDIMDKPTIMKLHEIREKLNFYDKDKHKHCRVPRLRDYV
jgi:PHP family Zn ribbon phosphoesterase